MRAIAFDPARATFLIETLRPERLTRVVDIGANPINDNPYRALLDLGGCEVWGFEPQESAYRKLLENPRPREHYLPDAVGSGEEGVLKVCKASGFTSLLEPDTQTFAALGVYPNAVVVRERVPIATRRLDDIADLPAFDLLKIDIQGGECAVFEHGRQKLSGAVAVISEVAAVPLYVDQPLLDEQMRVLRGLGFALHRFLFFKTVRRNAAGAEGLVPPRFGSQLLDGDAVFVRALLDLPALETEALKHLAILADSVFGSADLAAAALAALAGRGAIAAEAITRYGKQLA